MLPLYLSDFSFNRSYSMYYVLANLMDTTFNSPEGGISKAPPLPPSIECYWGELFTYAKLILRDDI